MASRTQLQPGNVYAIFGTETSRGVKEMGILVTAVAPDAKSLLLPCEHLTYQRGLAIYITGVPINVSAKSAKFQSAIQLNKVPQDACIDEINSDLTTYYCVRELSEKKWLEFYLNLLESKLEVRAKTAQTILDYGKNEKTGHVVPVSDLLNTHNVFLS
ncbi:hypothetical protein DFH11DRAFT_1648649 [Phellopilus nigrolimitatus]|nr:hypothetical protein DFH11DRAFT_1648649 [Phellopilus nigrolimitatus]